MKVIKIWDLPVRISHWLLTIGVLANLTVTEAGSTIHKLIGYTVTAIVLFRLLWGFIGSRHARFHDFWPTSKRLHAHWQLLKKGQPDPCLGHNPFGAVMMLILWGIMLGMGTSGYLMGTDAFWGDDTVQGIHKGLANSLIIFIGLHIIGALVMSYINKTNLIAAMITGKKKITD